MARVTVNTVAEAAKVALGPVAVVILAWASGIADDTVSLRVWELIVLGFVFMALLAGLVLLWRKVRRLTQAHPHRELLARIDALGKSLERKSGLRADASTVEIYNKVLDDAKAIPNVDRSVLDGLVSPRPPSGNGRSDQTKASLLTALGQIRSAVE
jgi:hypothetical protein